jgi:hypothetical protein
MDRLKTPRLRDLIETLDDLIVERLSVKNNSRWKPIHFRKPTHTAPLSSEEVHLFVQGELQIIPHWPALLASTGTPTRLNITKAYFTRVHPLHPFLDRQQFQDQVSSPGLDQLLIDNPAFSALYHAVMALGSQYCQEGSFEPGVGKAWELFQVSLGHMADLIAPRESFESLQVCHLHRCRDACLISLLKTST